MPSGLTGEVAECFAPGWLWSTRYVGHSKSAFEAANFE